MESLNNNSTPGGADAPLGSGNGFDAASSIGTDVVTKVGRFSARGKIIAGVVAVTVALGGGAAYALFNNSNVNLYVALGSWFKSDVNDITISMQINPDALRRSGTTDSEIRALNLPGVTTVDALATGLGQAKIHLQTNKSSGTLADTNYAIALQYGSVNVADMRLVDRVLYLNSEVNKLPEVNPQVVTRAQVDDAKASVEQYGSFLGSDSFVVRLLNTVLAGDTASVSLKSDTELGKQIDKALAQVTAAPTPSLPATTELQKFVVDALRDSSTIANEGSDSTGNKFLLSVDLAKFGKKLQQGLKDVNLGALESNRQEIENALSQLIAKASNQSLQMRAWAASGNLKRIDLDLSQIINLSEPTASLKNWDIAMRLDIGNESPASPAKSVDYTSDIDSLLKGLLSTGS